MLPKEALEEEEREGGGVLTERGSGGGGGEEGLPWFETMVKGSKLGNVKRSWGEGRSQNGRYTVEWEVVEWNGEDGAEGTKSPTKRKLGDVADEDAMEH